MPKSSNIKTFYLQVSKLAEGLSTSSESAHEGLDLIVDTLMGLQVSELSKSLATSRVGATVGPFAGMFTLVRLRSLKEKKQRNLNTTVRRRQDAGGVIESGS